MYVDRQARVAYRRLGGQDTAMQGRLAIDLRLAAKQYEVWGCMPAFQSRLKMNATGS